MSCNITSGIANGCNTNIGGVKNVWLANWPNVTTWYKYEMDKGTASLVETYNVNQAGSILGFTQTLTMQLNKMSADKQAEIAKIANQNKLLVKVQLNDDAVYQFGWKYTYPHVQDGAYLASGTTTTGTAYTDTNQSELVIQAHSKEPMDSAVMSLTASGTSLRGCYQTALGTGGQFQTVDWQNNTDFGFLTPDPIPSTGQVLSFFWPQDSGPNNTYRVECTFSGGYYTPNAFDAQGNSQVSFQIGTPWGGAGGPYHDFMQIINEPTQPNVVQTFKTIGEFRPPSGSSYNIFMAGTTQICADTPQNDRIFLNGGFDVTAKITRIQ